MSSSSDKLIEKNDIIETIIRMVTTADRKDGTGCLATFKEHVMLDHDAGSGRPEKVKATDMISGWENTFAGFDATWHSVTNFQVEVTGSYAVCKSYVQAIHCNFKALRGANYYMEYGNYNHELEHTEEGWKISAVQYRMVYSEGNSTLFSH